MCCRVMIVINLNIAVHREVFFNRPLRRWLSIQWILILDQEYVPFILLVPEVSRLFMFQSHLSLVPPYLLDR